MSGRIKLHRQIQDRPEWGSEPFTRGQARIDLVLLANHSEGFFYVRGNKVTVKRGQVGWSEIRLSEKRHWSRNKLRRWLKELETIQQIEQQKSPILSIITIVNYEKYQGNDTTDDTTERQQTIQQKNTNKNNKEEIKEKQSKGKYGEFANVRLTEDEYEKLQSKYIDFVDKIESLSLYIKSKGDKYKDHYATILAWDRKNKPAEPQTPQERKVLFDEMGMVAFRKKYGEDKAMNAAKLIF